MSTKVDTRDPILRFKGELKQDILGWRRVYFMDKVKNPLKKALNSLTNKHSGLFARIIALIQIVRMIRRYPEPTKENTVNPNSHVFIDVWDELIEYDELEVSKQLWRAFKKITVCEYEHDPPYKERMDMFLMRLFKAYLDGKWEFPIMDSPTNTWLNPESIKALAEARMEYAVSGTVRGRPLPWK